VKFASVHDNHREDRRWDLRCKAIPGLTFTGDKWISIMPGNGWDGAQEWNGVASNSFLVGFSSHHDNRREDRIYRFFTARLNNFVLGQCSRWRTLNNYDRPINLQLGDEEVIAGVKSVHNNHHEDRRFSVITCKIARPTNDALAVTRKEACESEHRNVHISCSNGHPINVVDAIYGLLQTDICSSRHFDHSCSANALSVVSNRCNGQQSCSIQASNANFGDPCYGSVKKLYIGYTCTIGGVLTSPNHPGNYPNSIDKTATLRVLEGRVMSLEFNAFYIEFDSWCRYDHLTIVDGDGTTLMEKSCGNMNLDGHVVIGDKRGSSLPVIRSRSNTVKFHFKTDHSLQRPGWSVKWAQVRGVGELHSGHLCPQTSVIESEEDCRNAAKWLQIPFAKAWNGPNSFPGCLVANDGRNKVYFNLSPHPSNQANNPKYGAICFTHLTLRTRTRTGVDSMPDFVSIATPHAKSEDATFSLDEIKRKCDYNNMDVYEDCTLYSAVDGSLQKAEIYSVGYVEAAIKMTKNLGGPKIQYLSEVGIMKINSGKDARDKIDFELFGAEASVFGSPTGAGITATAYLARGKVSFLELQLAFGVSSQIGEVDDSYTFKLFGMGGSVGRENRVCVFDSCIGFDLG